MKGIAGKPYLDLSDLFKKDDMDALWMEVGEFLVLNQSILSYTGGFHLTTRRVIDGMYPDHYDYGILISNMEDRLFEKYKELNPFTESIQTRDQLLNTAPNQKQKRFLKIMLGAFFPWQEHIELFPSNTQRLEQLPVLKRICEELPFDELKRIDILGVDPFHAVTIHKDWPADSNVLQEFVHITPGKTKSLFLFNPRSKEKIRLPKICYFNNNDLHGSDAQSYYTFSVRVEGIFSQAFRQKFNLL